MISALISFTISAWRTVQEHCYVSRLFMKEFYHFVTSLWTSQVVHNSILLFKCRIKPVLWKGVALSHKRILFRPGESCHLSSMWSCRDLSTDRYQIGAVSWFIGRLSSDFHIFKRAPLWSYSIQNHICIGKSKAQMHFMHFNGDVNRWPTDAGSLLQLRCHFLQILNISPVVLW